MKIKFFCFGWSRVEKREEKERKMREEETKQGTVERRSSAGKGDRVEKGVKKGWRRGWREKNGMGRG